MKIFLFLLVVLLYSCNPEMHITGSAMRYHNLSQNKYQPGKHRKKVKLGSSPNSIFWIIKKSI